MARIRLDGTWYEWNDDSISARKIQERFGVDQSRQIIFTTANIRVGTPLEEEEVPIAKDAVLQATTFPKNVHYGLDLSRLAGEQFKKLGQREKFILAQVFQVSERYFFRNQNALMLSETCDFLVIRDFPIPRTGSWVVRNAAICIYFPKHYPQSAPVGFFIDERSGGDHIYKGSGIYEQPDAFFKKHMLHKKKYGFYCWHTEDNWKPDLTNPLKPDNLDSLLKGIRFAMEEKGIVGRHRVKRIY